MPGILNRSKQVSLLHLPAFQQGVHPPPVQSQEVLGLRLATIHNLVFLFRFMEEIREAIRQDRLGQFREQFLRSMQDKP